MGRTARRHVPSVAGRRLPPDPPATRRLKIQLAMQRSRRRAPKFRPAPLKPRETLQEADSFCVACGSRHVALFPGGNSAGRRLVKCRSCRVIAPDFSQSRPRPGVRDDFVPLDKARAREMADQVLDAFTHHRTKQQLQRALAFAQGDLGLICHNYLPVAIEAVARVVSRFGFTESDEGVMESVRVLQTHAKDDEQLVQRLIGIRKVLTPTANWLQDDAEADKDDERRRELEQQALQQKREEERRQEQLAKENAKRARLRAKKIAMGLDPSVERAPVLVDAPPPVVAALENARLELRVNAKYVQRFQWFFNGRAIESEAAVSGINRCTLVIAKLTKRVAGEYRCTCENEEGTSLGTLSSSPMYVCEKNTVMACVGGKLSVWDGKLLAPVKAFPVLPTAMEVLAWDPQAKVAAAFPASRQLDQPDEACQVFFYAPERAGVASGAGASPTSRRRASSKVGLPAKPKGPAVGTFQLVDAQSVDAVAEVHAAAFLDGGKLLLVTDMTHRVVLYDVSPSFSCRHVVAIEHEVVCHAAATLQSPALFALAFRNKPLVKLYDCSSTELSESAVGFKFPVHRVSFDALGFFLAVAETGFMKSWLSIVNVKTKKPSSRRFVAHTGRISGLQWTRTTSLLLSSSLDGYVKVWDPVTTSNLLRVHVDAYGVHSMLLMEELSVLVVLGYGDCRLQNRSVVPLADLEASRLAEMHAQAATIQKLWKGRKTRELIAKYIREPGK